MHQLKPILANAITALSMALCLGYAVIVGADQVREIGWSDLVPTRDFKDPLDGLTEQQLYDLNLLVGARDLQASKPDRVTEELLDLVAQRENELLSQGVAVEELVPQFKDIMGRRLAIRQSVVAALDGEKVRVPGYMLPLEFDNKSVSEFFLVPYVGACIHVPPPPENQMIFVNAEDGIEIKGLYDPVWVAGTITTTGKTSPWNSFDGVLDISAGYTMEADRIDPYE